MARINPEVLSALKDFSFTYPTPLELLLFPPETLPTTEPATPQIGYTVAFANLPSIFPPPYSKKWIGMVIGAGRVATAATISWRMKKDGASVATGTLAVAANYYYTIQAWFYDVMAGNLLELALWSNQADSNYDYKAYQVHITRIIFYYKILSMLSVSLITAQPVLTLGNPTTPSANWWLYAIHADYTFTPDPTSYYARTNTLFAPFRILNPDSTYGTIYTRYGDITSQNNVTTTTHASSRPRYYRNYLPSNASLRYLTRREI